MTEVKTAGTLRPFADVNVAGALLVEAFVGTSWRQVLSNLGFQQLAGCNISCEEDSRR